jgi:GNAT superfamily N-acetyltransferase
LVLLAEQFRRDAPNTLTAVPDSTQLGIVVDTLMERGVLLVVDTDGEVTGMFGMLLGPHPLTSEPTAFEVAWFVAERARGGRTAFELFEAAELEARNRGALILQVGSPHARLDRVLERLGYARREVTYFKRLT